MIIQSTRVWVSGQFMEAQVEMVDGKYDLENPDDPSWLTVEVDEYDRTEGADVLQERNVSISVALNEGDDRSAVIFFMPPSGWNRGKELFNDDLSAIKDEFLQYAVSVTQLSSDQEFIMMLSSPSKMAEGGATFNISENSTLYTKFGETKYAYELLYTNQYARDCSRMIFTTAVSSYKVFNKYSTDKTDDSDFFISVELDEDRLGGVINMVEETKSTGYVVFYGTEDRVLAVVACTLDPDTVIGDVADVKFIGESEMYAPMVGATLERVTEGDLYDVYDEYMSPIYHLTYTMENMPMLISIPNSVKSYMPNPWSMINNFRVNGMDFDDGSFEFIDGGVQIYMTMPEGKQRIDGNIFFYSSSAPSNDSIVLVLVCTLDLTGSEE